MIYPYYFTDKALHIGLIFTLGSHRFNHAKSKAIIKPNYPDFGIEVRYINKIMKEFCYLC